MKQRISRSARAAVEMPTTAFRNPEGLSASGSARAGLCLFAVIMSFSVPGWSATEQATIKHDDVPASQQTAFRVRSDFTAGLNADRGWAGALNEHVTVHTDQPFRIRFELENSVAAGEERRFRLQYRHNGGAWRNVESADFPYPDEMTPRVSVIATDAYQNGAATTNLLAGSNASYSAGMGVDLAAISPSRSRGRVDSERVHSEWEWPLVIRRFADGAVTNDEGDTFEFRMAHAGGCPLESSINPVLTVAVPDGHLGGTFVETPGRIGPWQASNGDLYFLMEPSETYNVLMVVKSTDGGATWQEVDGAKRPATGDLEGFATKLRGNIIHMLHQTSDAVLYHAFRTSDHPTQPDTWHVRDELVASPEEPPTQVATLAVRSDGSIVGVYGGPEKIHFKIRSAEDSWGDETVVDVGVPPNLSGPQVVLGADDMVHLAYTGDDGTAWYRRIRPDGTLTPRKRLATGLGTSEGDIGSILPLVFIPETNTAGVIYRLATGSLWARRITQTRPDEPVEISDPARISDRDVVQNAVDSDQAGADAIAHGGAIHVLFIEQGTGRIFYTRSDEAGVWQPATLQEDGINAQWIRGMPITRRDGTSVYGYVYDAGSDGGSGMNRFAWVPLGGR